MANSLRFIFLLFVGVLVALGVALASPTAPAYAQTCDPSGSVDGTAEPAFVPDTSTVITFTATGFTPNEEVSFWFTEPGGSVVGTAAPLCCAAPDGRVLFAPDTMPEPFFLFPGKWALTVQGASSNHQSIIYFCLGVAQQPTPPPPTATTAPPPATATTAPPPGTATTAPPPGTATVAPPPPTTEASPTTVATAVATVEATATTMVPPTVAAPPTVPVPPTVAATATPGLIGMPVTGAGGSGDALFFVGLALVALSMMAIGLMARRAASDTKRK